jgi:hypothetical protein
MVLLGDMCQVEAHFDPFEIVFHDLCRMYHGMESFQAHLMVLLGNVCQVEASFGLFGDSINLDAR